MDLTLFCNIDDDVKEGTHQAFGVCWEGTFSKHGYNAALLITDSSFEELDEILHYLQVVLGKYCEVVKDKNGSRVLAE